MKRMPFVVLAAGMISLTLVGCGSGDDTDDASGLRRGTPASTTAAATSTPAKSGGASASATSAPATPGAAPAGANTTCGQFKALGDDAQKTVIDQILAANPGSVLEGSPSAALSTAKLVCSPSAVADTKVAALIGIKVP